MDLRRVSGQLKTIGLALTVATGLVGCGSNLSEQTAKDRLEQARTAYAQAKSNPLVESYAMKSLLESEKALQEAEKAKSTAYAPYHSGDQTVLFDDISRLAYISERKSQTTVALAEGIAARNEVVQLGKEKAEVQLMKSQLEKQQLKQNLDAMTSALEDSKRQLSLATSEADRAKILADIKEKEALLAKAQADAKAKEAEQAKAELAQLMKELSDLQGQMTDRGIVLTIGDVLFATGKSDLNASAQRSMDKLAEFLQKHLNRNLLVEGHTDSVGSDDYNQGLSEQRAASVKRALVDRGIADDRIVTIGYGKKYPLASNDTASGKQQNRRVEAIILNEGVKPESQFRK
jgi:outer membrane protein OmpA-like peptidoglycan-associated protein